MPIRVAVGPYFAPVQDATLRSAADAIPDLLTTELAGNARFQVVERAQVTAVVKELQLSADGLTSADTVLKLGKLLSADWLISGAIASSRTSTQLWSKVIDMRTGVVLDVQATPLSRDLVTSLIEVGRFVAKAGRSNSAPRQFVALGPFRDYTMIVGQSDCSRQLHTALEHRFRERGFGIVERESISMLAQEIDLDGKALTTRTNRMKLQAAFWLVDGGAQWLDASGTNQSISLRLQKVGTPGVFVRLTNAPGPALDVMMANAIGRILADASNPPPTLGARAEGTVQAARGYEVATARNAHADPNYLNSAKARSPEEMDNRRRDNLNIAIQRFEAAVALNPNDLESKHMLGYALTANVETAERGRALLWEVYNKHDPKASPRALNALAMDDLAERGASPGSRMSFPLGDLEQQIILLTNSADLTAKFKLGTSLLGYSSERNRQRGVAYLEEVAKSARADLGPSAEQALAEYRRRPARVPSASLPVKLAAPSAPTPTRIPAKQPAPADPGIRMEPEPPEQAARREFLQKNFNRFAPVPFEKEGPQLARLHRLAVKENMFDYAGKHYCGFRFTVPTWIDGNFRWMHILAKTEAQKDFSAQGFSWYIVPKTGRMEGFSSYSDLEVKKYAKLRERFPFTHVFFDQQLPRYCLKPGAEYAIWFSFNEADLPDIAFALTIASARGFQQFGILPMQ